MLTPFAYSLAGGMMVVLATSPIAKMAWRFLRNATLLVVALSAGAAAWQLRDTTWAAFIARSSWPILCAVACGVLAVAAVLFSRWGPKHAWSFRLLCLAGGIPGIVAACEPAWALVAERGGTTSLQLLAVTGRILASLLLGSITVAWLLGHAYLTATKMTILPLRHMSVMLSVSAAARIAFVLFSAFVLWSQEVEPRDAIVHAFESNWLFLSLRLGAGLLAVSVFAYMVADCVRLRSTQSATGILYFGSVFAYVGELAALHLSSECGWPV